MSNPFQHIHMQQYRLGDATFYAGSLPDDLRIGTDRFEHLWRLHPDDYHEISIHGRQVKTPRWQQAYGADYHYTGRTNRALPVPELLKPLLCWSKAHVHQRHNGILLNWYDAAFKHYIGRHRDSTRNMVNGAPIVTISFGSTRTFRMRRWRGSERFDFEAHDATVFIIPYTTNQTWTHEVPHFARNTGRRISITIRAFEPTGS